MMAFQVSKLNDNQLAYIRNRKIGLRPFSRSNLLPRMAAIDQVELPLLYGGGNHRRKRARKL